jgi:GntR family transcriptional regulator
MTATALKRSGLPLYRQLSALLEKELDSGKYPPGSQLPTDAQFSAAHGVSMITARAAMRLLLDKRRIARYPGKGTFVRADEDIRAEWGLGSIADLVVTGLKSKLVLLHRRLQAAPDWVAEKFSLPPGSKVYTFRTARESGGERFTIADIYQPVHIGRLITEADFKDSTRQNRLLISLVQEKTGIKANDIHQWMSAVLADAGTARQLGIAEGQPLLLAERDFYSADGRLIQTGRSSYRVDHYRYQMSFSRFPAG